MTFSHILITTHRGDMRIIACESQALLTDISADIEAKYGPKVTFNGFVSNMRGREPDLIVKARA